VTSATEVADPGVANLLKITTDNILGLSELPRRHAVDHADCQLRLDLDRRLTVRVRHVHMHARLLTGEAEQPERTLAEDGRGHPRKLASPEVVEHHHRIAPEPRQLRPLQRRLPERHAALLLIERQTIRRQRHHILPCNALPRPDGESSASCCQNFTFHGHTSWEMCR
jgi:hypothetical protein